MKRSSHVVEIGSRWVYVWNDPPHAYVKPINLQYGPWYECGGCDRRYTSSHHLKKGKCKSCRKRAV